jgi:hypothetical protein
VTIRSNVREARALSRLKNVIAREAAAATAPQWSSISPLEGEIAIPGGFKQLTLK